MPDVLILDSNYLCHAVYHSVPLLSFDERFTQIIYGFIKKVILYNEQFKPDNIVFAWDSKASIRREVYPNYKKQRIKAAKDQNEDEKRLKKIAYQQFDEIRDEILFQLGFTNVFMQDGYEADDIIASVIKSNPDYCFTVITTDSDIYQVISDNCRTFNPLTKTLRTVNTFKQEFGCYPSIWGKVKAIAGCSTDNVSGVRGVAEKTAIQYLTGKLNKNSKKYKEIECAKDLIGVNEEIVILPLLGTNEIKIIAENSLSRQSYAIMCETYGFRSMLSKNMIDKWDSLSVKLNYKAQA